MSQSVVCQACGSKLRAGRTRCLRCGEPLALAEPSERKRDWLRVTQGRVLVAGTGLSLVVLLVLAVASRWESAPQSTPPSLVSASPPAAALPFQEADAAEDSRAVEASDPAFLDPSRAGTAAYVRGDLDRAVERYREAIESNPKDLDSLNNLGQVLTRTGRPAEALSYFERAIVLDESRWAPRFNLARAYGELGDWSRAVEEYRKAADLFPDDYVTHYNLGLALQKQQQEEAAIVEFRRAIGLAPGEPSFRLSLGISYERLNRKDDAARSYQEYLELAPDSPDAGRLKTKIEELLSRAPAAASLTETPSDQATR